MGFVSTILGSALPPPETYVVITTHQELPHATLSNSLACRKDSRWLYGSRCNGPSARAGLWQDEPIEGGVPAITLDEAEEMALTIAMLPQALSESEKLHLRLEGLPL